MRFALAAMEVGRRGAGQLIQWGIEGIEQYAFSLAEAVPVTTACVIKQNRLHAVFTMGCNNTTAHFWTTPLECMETK